MSAKPPSDIAAVKERLEGLIESRDIAALGAVLRDLHPSDVADIIEVVEGDARVALVRALPTDVASEALAEMEGRLRGLLLAALSPDKSGQLLQELEDDDAADLVAELDPEARQRILETMPTEEAADIRGLLRYGEETAGGLMTTDLVAVRGDLTADAAIEEARRQGREVEDFYSIFVIDEQRHLLGTVPLASLIMAERSQLVSELVDPPLATVLPDLDQEEVGRILSHYNLVSVPVVDDEDLLLGRITFDDVIDVLEAEQTEDILRLAGVPEEEEIGGDWREAVRSRLPWLCLNLFTASVAASVVIVFAETVDRIWYLAAIMPIVAGMGGNSGTQALAVTVRRIAVGVGPLERKREAVGKEAVVALVNGAALGLMAFAVAWVAVKVDPDLPSQLPWVVLGAMWGTILLAGTFGSIIPTVLDRAGIDPAVASSVFVTTLTDLFGFFILLGLAALLLT